MEPFQPGEQVWAVLVEETEMYDLDKDLQPINRGMRPVVLVAAATVLHDGQSGQLLDGRMFGFLEGRVFRDGDQADEEARRISIRFDAGAKLGP